MRLRRKEFCPVHRSISCCGRELIPKTRTIRLGVQRVEDPRAAVRRNDAGTMTRILADDFVLVTGSGRTYTKADMLEEARRGDVYQRNDEEVQTVRVWGDTAVVTAKLWERYTSNGKSFDHKFWFSDTYVRTPAGWKYVFGQSSLALPSTVQ
jgi:ketosteroid isomerase-like protein